MFYVIGFEFDVGQVGQSMKSSFSGVIIARYWRLNALGNWQPYYLLEAVDGEHREFTYFVRPSKE